MVHNCSKVTYSYPMVTYSDPELTYSDPRVAHSDPKVTYSDLYWPCTPAPTSACLTLAPLKY